MNLHRAKMLIIALAAVTLLQITLCAFFKIELLFIGAALTFLLTMGVWVFFNRCPHCGKHLGDSSSLFCPHCGKKL